MHKISRWIINITFFVKDGAKIFWNFYTHLNLSSGSQVTGFAPRQLKSLRSSREVILTWPPTVPAFLTFLSFRLTVANWRTSFSNAPLLILIMSTIDWATSFRACISKELGVSDNNNYSFHLHINIINYHYSSVAFIASPDLDLIFLKVSLISSTSSLLTLSEVSTSDPDDLAVTKLISTPIKSRIEIYNFEW